MFELKKKHTIAGKVAETELQVYKDAEGYVDIDVSCSWGYNSDKANFLLTPEELAELIKYLTGEQ